MRKKLLSAITGAALVLSLTSACQASPPEIALEKAKSFQSRVLAITSSVADGGYAAALEALATLETELDAAAAEGSVSFARHQRIEAALSIVRADLQAAIDAQAEPEPEPEPEPAPVEPTAPVEDDDEDQDVETDAEKKAREDAAKAAEEAKKKAEQEQKEADDKAAEEARKAAEEAQKKADEAREKAEEDAKKKGNVGNTGNGEDKNDDD